MEENNPLDIFSQLFGNLNQVPQAPMPEPPEPHKVEVAGLYCNKCESDLETVHVIVALGDSRKIFYCKNNHCPRFGLLTVVAKNKKLV